MHTARAGWRCSASLIYCPLVANPLKTTALFPATGPHRIPTKGESLTHLNFISKTYNLIFISHFCVLFSMLMTLNHRKSIHPSSRTANSTQKGPKAGNQEVVILWSVMTSSSTRWVVEGRYSNPTTTLLKYFMEKSDERPPSAREYYCHLVAKHVHCN